MVVVVLEVPSSAGGGMARLHLPVESMHVLREALGNRREGEEELRPRPAEEEDDANTLAGAKKRKQLREALLASMDAALVAHSIIKDEAADRRLHALAIARRIAYCLDA